MLLKSCTHIILGLLISCLAYGQRIEERANDPHEKVAGLDQYFIIYTTGEQFKVSFRKQELMFTDSTALEKYMRKNILRIDKKIAIQANRKSNPALYRKAVQITQGLGIRTFRIIE